MMRRIGLVLGLALACAVGCGGSPDLPSAPSSGRESGFLVVSPRDVSVHGKTTHVGAEARLFYDFVPSDEDPATRPIVVLTNGFSARIVRAFGTGPVTVDAENGSVRPNPSTLTRFANLLYIDPRQSGFSYDVVRGRGPTLAEDCGAGIFNEYVDAGDVLLATLAFLRAHPTLRGPLVWLGESYAAVRVQWILAFLRGRWDLAPYDDQALRTAIANAQHPASLHARQILLEPWLVGRAQTTANDALASDAEFAARIAAELGTTCSGNLSQCAKSRGRSVYDVRLTEAAQATREWNAAMAHVVPDRAAALFGVPLEAITGLRDRRQGFKCNPVDSETPPDEALTSRFGALPRGQSYFIPSSPLQPDKAVDRTPADWWTTNLVGYAFVDNVIDVPTFLTDGALDLVAPAAALPAALGEVLGNGSANRTNAHALALVLDDGSRRTVTVGTYPNAGHMITIDEAPAFAADVEAWLAK